ncbi:hypothetical protein D3C78_515760 [compost metagenome]
MTVVTLLQTVLAIEAGLGEEVLGEVVLQTRAEVGHGQVLTAAVGVVDVGDALVAQASRDVGTQRGGTRGTEVVDGVQGAQVAMNLLVTGFVGATNVVVLTIGQRQLDIVGQEVADRAAIQIAVLHVANAVSEVALAEEFRFDRALALSEGIHSGGGDQRANNDA